MKHFVISIVFLFVLFSCSGSKSKQEVERISLTPTQVVSDSIEAMMPGEMYLAGEYLLWTDPFSSEMFAHIVDLNTGKEVGRMVQKGEGPREFVSPSLSVMPDNQIFVYDRFADRSAVFSIAECVAGREAMVEQRTNSFKDVTSVLYMKDGERIVFSPSENKPFKREDSGKEFGKLPFKGEISNSYDHFQGLVRFNPYNGYLYYSTFKMPYFALYKKDGKNFKLEVEELRTDECTVRDGNLIYRGNKRGPIEATLTTDYIVTVDTDPQSETIDYFKIGRDYNKLPHTLCLYDYALNLRKVIDLGMPVLRIVSSSDDNTLYFLSVNPDFVIYKLDL